MTSRHRSEVRVAIDGPAADESLSSLLDRSASFWGVDRSAMVAALEFGPADDDPDAPSQAALHTLSLATGFSAARLDTHRIANVWRCCRPLSKALATRWPKKGVLLALARATCWRQTRTNVIDFLKIAE